MTRVDAAGAPDAADGADAPDAPDVPDAADGVDAPEMADAPYAADAPADQHVEVGVAPDRDVDRRKQRRRWDDVAEVIPDLWDAPSTRYYRRCEIALIRRSFGPLRGRRLLKLDLWNEAVNTRILQWAHEQGAEAWGLDHGTATTDRARARCRGRHAGIRILQADIRDLPFPDRSFDLLYTMGTIEHIDEYQRAVNEIHRVLRPGGRAIVGVPHRWNLFLRPLMVRILDALDLYLYSPERSFSHREIREVVEAAGLRVRRRRGILTIPGVVRMLDLFLFTRGVPLYRLTPLVLKPFELLETGWEWPGRFGYLIALEVERPASDPEAAST